MFLFSFMLLVDTMAKRSWIYQTRAKEWQTTPMEWRMNTRVRCDKRLSTWCTLSQLELENRGDGTWSKTFYWLYLVRYWYLVCISLILFVLETCSGYKQFNKKLHEHSLRKILSKSRRKYAYSCTTLFILDPPFLFANIKFRFVNSTPKNPRVPSSMRICIFFRHIGSAILNFWILTLDS